MFVIACAYCTAYARLQRPRRLELAQEPEPRGGDQLGRDEPIIIIIVISIIFIIIITTIDAITITLTLTLTITITVILLLPVLSLLSSSLVSPRRMTRPSRRKRRPASSHARRGTAYIICLCIHIYIYIYIYMSKRERERYTNTKTILA